VKILCLADEENKAYWDYFRKEKLDDIDLILSCGDLKADYLTFLVTMGHAPLLYIHGNHDEGYRTRPPEGCDCIDYRPGEYQYSEADMQRRIRRMSWKLRKGVDIVVAHAPVQGFGDLEDLPHRGFACFRKLIEKYMPKYLLHGHVHASYGHGMRKEYNYCGTHIINVGETYILEIPDDALQGQTSRK